ncbi:MAG: DUF2975 domain-containing protein [Halieaceae bacterium]|nr:DUF2975 domain-containing protein [Halieaceae bacterium]
MLAVLAPVIAALLLARAAWLWVNFDSQLLPYYLAQGIRVTPEKIESWQWVSAALTANVALLLLCLALLRAGRIFRLVSQGERIAASVVAHLSRTAALIFAAALVKIPLDALTSLLLTINNEAGSRSLRLAFSSSELVGIIAAGLLWALASTLREAVSIRQENDAFV